MVVLAGSDFVDHLAKRRRVEEHGIADGDTDAVKAAKSILAQASLLKCTVEVFSGSPSEGMDNSIE
jgi:hypothetical protein